MKRSRFTDEQINWVLGEQEAGVKNGSKCVAAAGKRALGTRAPLALPQGPNELWSLHFLSDTLIDSRRFRILAVLDNLTLKCLTLVADTSLSGVRVGRALDAIIAGRGKPLSIVSDNGTELTLKAMLR